MRRFLFGITTISILLVITGTGATAALAAAGPLQPGDALFPWQYFAEQSRDFLIRTEAGHAQYFVSIAERRAADLGTAAGTSDELLSIYYLNQALDQATLAVATTNAADFESLRLKLAGLILQIRSSLEFLSVMPAEQPDILESFVAKIDSAQNLVIDPETTSGDFATIAGSGEFTATLSSDVSVPGFVKKNDADNLVAGGPQSIPFPENSPGAQHNFFPLIGQHATADCESCHTTSQYVGTANTCEACHANVKPANHFDRDCAGCHTSTSWQDVNFDHQLAGASDCQTCHSDDKPINHFKGQCSKCHSTSGWLPANFDHSGQADCQSCHGGDKPANHFSGQCSKCHTTSGWLPASFDHSGQADCQACHTRPTGHYSGQCSQCHSTSTWSGAAFHVAGANCQACHSRPSGHYRGQCSQCHRTSGWEGASYHFVGANCVACHSGHTTQQCSNCHNTRSWDDDDGGKSGGKEDDDD